MSGRGIAVARTTVTLSAHVARDLLEARLGPLPVHAPADVAAQVHAYVKAKRLGYCPPLAFFAESAEVDARLIAAIAEAGAFVCDYARSEARARLWPVFSQVRVQRVQSLALTLPSVRPRQPGALERLARHYTPTGVRLDLTLSSLERGAPVPGLERLAANKVRWWLRESFETVEVTAAKLV